MKINKFLIILIIVFIQSIAPNILQAKNISEPTDNYIYINIKYWEKFNDNILVNHINNLYYNNPDIKIAGYKVEEGERAVKLALSNELPRLDFDGYLGRTLTSSDEKFGNLIIPDYSQYRYLLPLTLSYEADIWGKRRLHTKSSKKQLDMIKEDEKLLYIYLTSNFTINYFNLIKTDKLLELQNKLISVQKQICEYTQKQFNQGIATQNDIISEEKKLTLLEENKNNLEEKRDTLLNQISVYLGDRSFSEIERSSYDSINVQINIPSEIPFEIIEKRPDVRKAIYGIEKTGLDIKAARRDFLPSFTITGNLGYNAYSMQNLFGTHTGLADIGINPYINIFDGGAKYNRLKLLRSKYNKMFIEYQKTLLTCAQEVNDALFLLKTSENNYIITNNRANLQKKDYNLIQKKEKFGIAHKIDVLNAEQINYLIEQMLVSAKINEIISSVNLYKSLGGYDLHLLNEINL